VLSGGTDIGYVTEVGRTYVEREHMKWRDHRTNLFLFLP